MKFSELENIRVKLDDEGERVFWDKIDKKGGIKNFCQKNNVSSAKMYNWSSKDVFMPVEVVREVLGDKASDYIQAYKGKGRSRAIRNPVFPLPENSELLTRIECSVNINSQGIPVYQTTDGGLLERFNHLLQDMGEVPVKIYMRDVYELRYPKFLHRILSDIQFEESLNAKVDEIGQVREEVVLEDEEIDLQRIGKLYHQEKRMKLALTKQDEEEITRLMREEKERVRNYLIN